MSSNEFPIEGKVFTLDVALIPMMAVKFSKKISLDFKIIPNILLADFGSINVGNPILPKNQQQGIREYNLPEINLAFSILLRYQIKEAQKRRRRRP